MVELILREQTDSSMKRYPARSTTHYDPFGFVFINNSLSLSLFPPAFLSVLFTKISLVEFRGSSFNPVARAVANRECEIQSALQSCWKLVRAEYRGARIFNVLPTLCIGEYNEFGLCSASWRLREPNLVLACSKLWSLLHWNEAHERLNFILRKRKPCSTKTKALFYIFHLLSYTM